LRNPSLPLAATLILFASAFAPSFGQSIKTCTEAFRACLNPPPGYFEATNASARKLRCGNLRSSCLKTGEASAPGFGVLSGLARR
jgi:hypothetical protein